MKISIDSDKMENGPKNYQILQNG